MKIDSDYRDKAKKAGVWDQTSQIEQVNCNANDLLKLSQEAAASKKKIGELQVQLETEMREYNQLKFKAQQTYAEGANIARVLQDSQT